MCVCTVTALFAVIVCTKLRLVSFQFINNRTAFGGNFVFHFRKIIDGGWEINRQKQGINNFV